MLHLSTISATTDSESQLTVSKSGYTSASLSFTNTSDSSAVYRIRNNTSTSESIQVKPKATATFVESNLDQGVLYHFYLEREEVGKWVSQGNAVSVLTKKLEVNVSTSSVAGKLTWYGEFSYRVIILPEENEVGYFFNTETQKNEVILTNLSPSAKYYASIQVYENSNYFELKQVEVTPSPFANLNIDAVFASYVQLSWDDGNVGSYESDGSAEFMIEVIGNERSFTHLGWTSDVTSNVTNLVPGEEYKFLLSRKGVDGEKILQDTRSVVTKNIPPMNITSYSSSLSLSWDLLYEGARYEIYSEEENQEKVHKYSSKENNATSYVISDLSPETFYTLYLFVVEKGEMFLLRSITSSTDPLSTLSKNEVRYTSLSLIIETFHASDSSYILKGPLQFATTLGGKNTSHMMDMTGFTKDTSFEILLVRIEEGIERPQDRVLVTTPNVTTATSVASKSAMVQWDQAYENAIFEVVLFDNRERSGNPIDQVLNSNIDISSSLRSCIFTDLQMKTPYWGYVAVKEEEDTIIVSEFSFETSAGAVLQVTKVRASYVHLSWDVGEVKESDGVAEFLVRVSGEDVNDSNWLPHTNASTIISDLQPGTSYAFELVRKGLDGNAVTQAYVDVTTKTSTLTIANTGSSYVTVEWTELYPNAQYHLSFEPITENSSAQVIGPIPETTYIIENLKPTTTYLIELKALESSSLVGIANATLTLEAIPKTSYFGYLTSFIIVLVLLILATKNNFR